jgi:hypothetical protein
LWHWLSAVESRRVNKALARVVERELAGTGAFVVAQHEIGDHLRLGQTDDNKQMFVVRKNRDPDEDYIDTREVLEQAWDEMKKLRPNLPEFETIIVAHKAHIWRAFETALAIGFKVVGVANTRHIGYDWWSKQLWTKFGFVFVPYERLARLIYLKRGWILKPNPDD